MAKNKSEQMLKGFGSLVFTKSKRRIHYKAPKVREEISKRIGRIWSKVGSNMDKALNEYGKNEQESIKK